MNDEDLQYTAEIYLRDGNVLELKVTKLDWTNGLDGKIKSMDWSQKGGTDILRYIDLEQIVAIIQLKEQEDVS